jgi:cytohesin
VARRNRATVHFLLARGADPDAATRGGATALHLSAYMAHPWLLEALLDRRADPNARDARGRTPLHWAAYFGHASAVATLIGRGAGVDAKDASGHSPASLGARACRRDIVRAFVQAGVPGADRLPFEACPAAPVQPAGARAAADGGIHAAASRAEVRKIRELNEAGAPVDERDAEMKTALHQLVRFHATVRELQQLIARGADVNARDSRGRTPLHAAVLSRNDDATKALLAAGSRIGALDLEGSTPLHLLGHSDPGMADPVQIVAALLDRGANPNARDLRGRTLLHDICDESDHPMADGPVAEYLVCRGADTSIEDRFGWTAADIASVRGWPRSDEIRCGPAGRRLTLPDFGAPPEPRLLY